MSVIKVTLPLGEIPAEGKLVSFKAPCTCTVTDGIQIEGVTYTVCDALGVPVTGASGVWDVGSIVTVVLSLEQQKAYIQNNAGYSPSNKPTLADVIGSNENLLDNWYFADPIDQRGGYLVKPGQNLYSAADLTVAADPSDGYYRVISHDDMSAHIQINGVDKWAYFPHCVRGYEGRSKLGYTIDRWKTRNYAPVLTYNGEYLTFATHDHAAWYYLDQYIEAKRLLPGATYTLSVLTDTGLHTITFVRGAKESEAVWFDNIALWYTEGASEKASGIAGVTLGTSTVNKTIKLCGIKLELGSVQTLVHQDANGNWVLNDPPPDKGVETLKCATSTADSTDTFANMGAGATKTITATLSTSWTASGNYFYQDVAANGILATDTPVVGVNPGSDNAANVNYSMAFSNVFRVTTSANSIRVWVRSKPTVAIPIQIKVVR